MGATLLEILFDSVRRRYSGDVGRRGIRRQRSETGPTDNNDPLADNCV
jgi:hypothetical protein